jgi:hypothetical protein
MYQGMEEQVGPYINTIPVRTVFDAPKTTFKQLVATVGKTLLDGYENAGYPFDLIVEEVVEGAYKTSQNPLFDVMVSYMEQDQSHLARHVSGLSIHPMHIPQTASQFWLAIDFIRSGNALKVVMNYDTSLFKEISILLLKERLFGIIDLVMAEPERMLNSIEPDAILRKEYRTADVVFDY